MSINHNFNFNYEELFFPKPPSPVFESKRQKGANSNEQSSLIYAQLFKPIVASEAAPAVQRSIPSTAGDEENVFIPGTPDEEESLMDRVSRMPHISASQIEDLPPDDLQQPAKSSAALNSIDEILALSLEPDCSDKVVSAFLKEIRKTLTTACNKKKLECIEHLDSIYKLSLHLTQLSNQVYEEKKPLSKFRPPKKKLPSPPSEEATALIQEAEAIALRQSKLHILELHNELTKLRREIVGKHDFNTLTRDILSSAPQHLLRIPLVKASLASMIRELCTSSENYIKNHCKALNERQTKAISQKERLNQLRAEKEAILQDKAAPIEQLHLEETINQILDKRLSSFKANSSASPSTSSPQQPKNARRQRATPGNTVKHTKGTHHQQQRIIVVKGPDLRFTHSQPPPPKPIPQKPITPKPISPLPTPKKLVQHSLPPPARESTPTLTTSIQKDTGAVLDNAGTHYSLRPRSSLAKKSKGKETSNP